MGGVHTSRVPHRCVICGTRIPANAVYRDLDVSGREKAHLDCQWPWDARRSEFYDVQTEARR